MPALNDDRAVDNFKEYLKIQSVHPTPDYDGCVSFLKKLATEIGLKSKVVRLSETRPVLILTWEGESPHLPSILLNSHMDVVPVIKEEWTYDPFSAYVDNNGNIYARGSQDMKCATIAELEAIRRLRASGVKLKRTVHMTIVPDEEIGSAEGMAKFVETDSFKDLNIGFDLDEGCCSTDDNAIIHKNERCRWAMNIHCPGTISDDLVLHKDSAGEKARAVIDSFMDFREKEVKRYKVAGSLAALGDVTTINLTTLEGPRQENGGASEFVIGFDMRIGADEDHRTIQRWLQDVLNKAGEGVHAKFIQKDSKTHRTCHDDNPFFVTLETTLKKLGHEIIKVNCFGATDGRFARQKGIPVLGFAPFYNTVTLIHGTDEHMNIQIFLQAISEYEKIISALASC